jgi:hypothetical protein
MIGTPTSCAANVRFTTWWQDLQPTLAGENAIASARAASVTVDVILRERHEAFAHGVQTFAACYGSPRSDAGSGFWKDG